MNPQTLTLKNFLQYADATFTFKPLTIIASPNGGGKTAVANAIEFALTGTCRGLQYKNRAGELCRQGQTKLEVALTADTGTFVRNHKGEGANGLTPEVAAVLTSPMAVIAMKPAERQGFFREYLIAGGITPSLSMAPTKVGPGTPFASVVKALAVGDIDKAEAEAVSVRRMVKRQIEGLGDGPPTLPDKFLIAPGKELSLATVDVAAYEKRRDEFAAAKGQIEAKLAMIDPAKADELRQQLAGMETTGTTSEARLTEIGAEIETHTQEMARLDKDRLPKEQEVNRLVAEQKVLADLVGKLGQFKGDCVLSRRIQCPITPEQAQSLAGQSEKKIEAVETKIANMKAEVDEFLAEWSNHKDEIASLRKEEAGLVNNTNRAAAQAEAMAAKLKEMDEAAAAKPQLETQLQSFAEKHRAISAVIEKAREYQATVNAQVQHEANRTKLAAELELAEQVCDELGKDGRIRAEAGAAAEQVTFGYVPPEWDMDSLAIDREGNVLLYGRRIELASRSQQWRAGLMIAQLLARKVGWWCIDEFDILTQKLRGPFLQQIGKVMAGIGTTILLCASDTPPTPPQNDRTAKYWVVEGKVTQI